MTREVKIIDLAFDKERNDMIASCIKSIMGQMSDGAWEDSKQVVPWWKYVDVVSYNDGVWFEISGSGYYHFDCTGDKKFKKYYADKLKQIFKKENEWNNDRLGKWSRDNETKMEYLDKGSKHNYENFKVSEVYYVYDLLMERDMKKHWGEDCYGA